jgi:hypothetical protein
VPGVDRKRGPLKLAAAAAVLATMGLACAPAGNPPVLPVQLASAFVTQVVAGGNDAGRMPSAAIGTDGTPFVSYLLLKPTLTEGQLPPAVIPSTPQPPAVIVASLSAQQGYWVRTSASGQDYSKAKGTDATIADKDGKFLPGVSTAVAVDAQGKAHVVWATPSGLSYTDDTASAAFADPEQVTKDAALGASIAVDPSGTPWIAYYDGSAVTLATKANGQWVTQLLSQVSSCPSCPPVRTAIQLAGSTPVVAFTDFGQARVATVQGSTVTTAAIGTGGFGISLALGKDGVGYAAYYTKEGAVNLATSSGPAGSATAWSEKPVAAAPAASPAADPSGWATGIGVEDSGTAHVAWVDVAANDVKVGTGSPSSPLKVDTVPQSLGGQSPSLAVSPDGKTIVVPFYDSVNHQLGVAVPAKSGLALGVPSPSPSPPPTPPSGPPCSPTSDSNQLQVTAAVGAAASGFDPTCLAVVPDTAFTVAFDDQDTTAPHNWELFKDPAYTQRVGGATGPSDIVTGPTTQNYQVDALGAAIYYFRCDVHPTTMIGQLVVAKVGPQPGPSGSSAT